MEFVLLASLLINILLGLCLSFTLKVIRGNGRENERQRNIHNHQISELLDRLAHAYRNAWNLPVREIQPAALTDPDQEEAPEVDWREV